MVNSGWERSGCALVGRGWGGGGGLRLPDTLI